MCKYETLSFKELLKLMVDDEKSSKDLEQLSIKYNQFVQLTNKDAQIYTNKMFYFGIIEKELLIPANSIKKYALKNWTGKWCLECKLYDGTKKNLQVPPQIYLEHGDIKERDNPRSVIKKHLNKLCQAVTEMLQSFYKIYMNIEDELMLNNSNEEENYLPLQFDQIDEEDINEEFETSLLQYQKQKEDRKLNEQNNRQEDNDKTLIQYTNCVPNDKQQCEENSRLYQQEQTQDRNFDDAQKKQKDFDNRGGQEIIERQRVQIDEHTTPLVNGRTSFTNNQVLQKIVQQQHREQVTNPIKESRTQTPSIKSTENQSTQELIRQQRIVDSRKRRAEALEDMRNLGVCSKKQKVMDSMLK